MKSLVQPLLVLLLAALAASPAAAQQPGAARERAEAERARAAAERMHAAQGALHQDAERRAFDMLLRHRATLALTEQQVRELETIRTRLEQQNAPLRQRLVEQHLHLQAERRSRLERMSAEQRLAELRRLRRERPGVPQSLQPTVRQMRLHIDEAVHRAQGVLTAEQRLRVRELVHQELREVRRTHPQERRVTREEVLRRQRQVERRQREAERAREHAREP